MDSSMKGKIMTGMIVGAFLLALLAVIGSSWMTLDEDGLESNYGLSEYEVSLTIGDETESATVKYSDGCQIAKDVGGNEDEVCGLATAGLVGTIGMWIGIIMAGTYAAMMILPMVGSDVMNAIPEIGQKVISWGAGGMMLLGAIGWLILKPEIVGLDTSLGISFFMAIFGGILALVVPVMDMFVAADGE